ncbi:MULTISPECIES: vitamin K epoxide reductase family protein [Dietzia]|uniref:Vitamin K epoxide reductase family protein n=1 Tax=Dietzia cinnamea TaxID=321318 RepID=A0AAW5Q5Z9_9ACTN|nr:MULTISPECIES: vitamin K epoxide reductase family protein [Dietzia]MCT1639701.1 vitamin K epoxide reductase family protein [Dietzia cinnamea]MCT1864981.1 vitamin K epoxide reductase family protein [Dietzia cinnamea]MCT2029066.1 vitamin K epoxide reductase family protein [Dietzia cinnamea]MCT2034498.1 vitamin K epoxide reductase family protein [Dietzia cinnamea]MCT2062552.1 vitamin K epoxide reductase family protein [Dietzia cinnamea]
MRETTHAVDPSPAAGTTGGGSRVFTDRWIGVLLAIGSAIALVASFQLSLDKIRLLENPDYTPACNFSILMSCKSVINSEQGAAFGFPNPFIGLVGYGIVIAIGVAAASGVRLPRWYWVGTLLGLTFASGFVHWLAFQSIFSIQVLCPWCMVVWATTIPMFWYTLLHVLAKLTAARWVRTLQQWHLVPVVVWFLAVAGVILWAFWDFYWADFFANL